MRLLRTLTLFVGMENHSPSPWATGPLRGPLEPRCHFSPFLSPLSNAAPRWASGRCGCGTLCFLPKLLRLAEGPPSKEGVVLSPYCTLCLAGSWKGAGSRAIPQSNQIGVPEGGTGHGS